MIQQMEGKKVEAVTDFIFLGSKITADGDWSHEIKKRLLLGGKTITNLDTILKSRHTTLLTKVCIVKAMVFPVVVYGCEKGKVKVAQSCPTLCNPIDCSTGKTIALTRRTFVGKVMSLLFNMLSRLVTTFLPRVSIFKYHGCNHHLQWFWSPEK